MSHNLNHVDKEMGSASYRLTSNDGWILVSGDKRHSVGGYWAHTGSYDTKGYDTKGYGTNNFNRPYINRSKFKRDDGKCDAISDNRTTVTKNVRTDNDELKKRFDTNPQYNEFHRDDNVRSENVRFETHPKHQRVTESHKKLTSPHKTGHVDDHQKIEHTIHNDEFDPENAESLKKQKNDNYKKILCKNININGRCIYNNKCLYAHTLEEQNIEPIRAIAYSMIKKKNDLSHIDLSKDKHLYNHLHSLSKVCQHCNEGSCTGGYNCKHGACDKIYVVCQTDLNKGTCEGACGKLHLTSKGLMPYGVSIVKNLKTKITIPKATVINEDFFKKLSQNIAKTDSESVQKSVMRFVRKESDDDNSEIDMNNHTDHIDAHTDNTDSYAENRWDSFVSSSDDNKVLVKKKSENIKENDNDNDNDSLCSDASEKIDHILNFFPVKTDGNNNDSFDDFKLDNISKRYEKLTMSIFKIDFMHI